MSCPLRPCFTSIICKHFRFNVPYQCTSRPNLHPVILSLVLYRCFIPLPFFLMKKSFLLMFFSFTPTFLGTQIGLKQHLGL